MKQDINYPFTMQFLIERYEVRRQSLLEYTKNHISELNEGGVHARKFGKEWRFDEVAVSRLDELRGYLGASVATNNYETAEMVRIAELEKELAEANENIGELKAEVASKDAIIKNQNNLIGLIEAKQEQLLLQSSQAEDKTAEQAKEIERLEAESVVAQGEIKELEKRAMEAENALAEERSKSLWKLIVERFTK